VSTDTTTRLLELARGQHEVVATHQGRCFGTTAELRREFETHRWNREARSVFGVAGAPHTALYMAMARLLRAGPGAVISHQSALVLWGIVAAPLDPLHVTRMRAANGSKLRGDGIVPHETRRMPPHHVTRHCDFPIVTPSRALFDVASITPIGRVERWLDRVWTMRLVDHGSLRTTYEDLDKRGRRGVRPMGLLLGTRGVDYVAPESGLEGRLNHILRKADLPRVRRQVEVGGEQWLGRVDFRLGATPLLIEVQSDTYHWSLTSAQDDLRRAQALEAAGFRVVPIWESTLWSDNQGVVATVEAALRELRRWPGGVCQREVSLRGRLTLAGGMGGPWLSSAGLRARRPRGPP
jgi:very-short-patch-repair endonuclease